jgi:hypothetical protein
VLHLSHHLSHQAAQMEHARAAQAQAQAQVQAQQMQKQMEMQVQKSHLHAKVQTLAAQQMEMQEQVLAAKAFVQQHSMTSAQVRRPCVASRGVAWLPCRPASQQAPLHAGGCSKGVALQPERGMKESDAGSLWWLNVCPARTACTPGPAAAGVPVPSSSCAAAAAARILTSSAGWG